MTFKKHGDAKPIGKPIKIEKPEEEKKKKPEKK